MARLIYLMGPSGAGKDCLLSALRNATPQNRVVAHRYITRPADAGAENHVALSKQEFIQRAEQGLFALHWQAHQHCYAIGIEINLWLQHGLDVLVNGSRAYLPEAQRRYRHQLLPSVSPSPQRFWHNGCGNGGEKIANKLMPACNGRNTISSNFLLTVCNCVMTVSYNTP